MRILVVAMLETLPADHPERPFYTDLFQTMSRAIFDAQQPDGFWNLNLDDPAHVPLHETSGTALFVRAFASGIRQGLLDYETYWPRVQLGWHALEHAIRTNGAVTMVQPPAPEPRKFNPATTEPYGTGAVLSAGTEILRALDALPGLDQTQLLQTATMLADDAPDLWRGGEAVCVVDVDGG